MLSLLCATKFKQELGKDVNRIGFDSCKRLLVKPIPKRGPPPPPPSPRPASECSVAVAFWMRGRVLTILHGVAAGGGDVGRWR